MVDYKSIKIICDIRNEKNSLNLLIIHKLYITMENRKISIKNKTKFYQNFFTVINYAEG